MRSDITPESSQPRRVPEEVAATSEEIASAIDGLTRGQLIKLERYARFRIRGLGRAAQGRDADDLLKEALTSILGGNRRWNRNNVDFVAFLMGAMRSISSHWGERGRGNEAYLESELADPTERGPGLFETAVSDMPDPERRLSAKQELARIEDYFADDVVVSKIIQGMRMGMTGPEIQSSASLTRAEYETGVKRMRRGLVHFSREGGNA